jgi:hypothetical protein
MASQENSLFARATRLVTNLNPNDILLGRGAPLAYYEGNVRFRELVGTRKSEYMTSGRHQRKQAIARELYDEMGRRNGRFLARMDPAEASALGVPNGIKAWFVADEAVALEKIKQALRERDTLEGAPPVPSPAQEVSNVELERVPHAAVSSTAVTTQSGPIENLSSPQVRTPMMQQPFQHLVGPPVSSVGSSTWQSNEQHTALSQSIARTALQQHQVGLAGPTSQHPSLGPLLPVGRSDAIGIGVLLLQNSQQGRLHVDNATAQPPAQISNGVSISNDLALAILLQERESSRQWQQLEQDCRNREFIRQYKHIRLQQQLFDLSSPISFNNALLHNLQAPNNVMLLADPLWTANAPTSATRLIAPEYAAMTQNTHPQAPALWPHQNTATNISLPSTIDPALAQLLRSSEVANLSRASLSAEVPLGNTNGSALTNDCHSTNVTLAALLRHQASTLASVNDSSLNGFSSPVARLDPAATKQPASSSPSDTAPVKRDQPTSSPSTDEDRKPRALKRNKASDSQSSSSTSTLQPSDNQD